MKKKENLYRAAYKKCLIIFMYSGAYKDKNMFIWIKKLQTNMFEGLISVTLNY